MNLRCIGIHLNMTTFFFKKKLKITFQCCFYLSGETISYSFGLDSFGLDASVVID